MLLQFTSLPYALSEWRQNRYVVNDNEASFAFISSYMRSSKLGHIKNVL